MSDPVMITILSHCQHTDHPLFSTQVVLVTLNKVRDGDKVTGSKARRSRANLCGAAGKAAALPLKSLLLLQAKLLLEGLLLLLPDWPLAGNCYDGALCSRALSAAPLEAALKAARQQASTGRGPPQAPPSLRRGEGLTAHFKLQAVFPKLCTAIFLR